MKMIHNIKQLAEHVGVPSCFTGDYGAAVERSVFKNTECGCTFSHDEHGIEVSGYAEGADAECPMHRLDYPFAAESFWVTLEMADEEGCAMWDEWNTQAMECPRCKEIALEPDRIEATLTTYECAACGHVEVHNASLPSWHY